MTAAETTLWERLRNRQLGGFKFRRQSPLGPFIADFYCASSRLVVEVDGGVHIGQAQADQQRSQRLVDYGYRVLRVGNHEVEADLAGVLQRILAACHGSGRPPLPGLGEACPEFVEGGRGEG